MSDKFTMQELVELLAKRHDMDIANAEVFVKTLFALIEETLASDKYVKVKGLGTFKLIDVDKRESVDVNTGERIEIQGHSKIVFLPDLKMRETVNKPFSHFETVLLNEDVRFDDMTEESKADESLVEDKSETVGDELDDETLKKDSENSSSTQIVLAREDTGKNEAQELQTPESTSELIEEGEMEEYSHRKRMGTVWLILITLFLGIIIGGGIVWLTLAKQQMIQNHPEQVVNVDSCMNLEENSSNDSVFLQEDSVVSVVDTLLDTVSMQKKGDVLLVSKKAEVLTDTVEYRIVGTLSSYTIKKGESLVRLSLKFYGTKKLWPYIAQYNREVLKDADDVPVGTVIRIPELKPKAEN